MAYQETGQPEAAEDAYRKSLAISVRLGDVAMQAGTLNQLGILYDDVLGRTEEAVAFFRQAMNKYVEISDVASEGSQRSNLAIYLRKLRRLDEARQEILRTIECDAQFGHAAEPWRPGPSSPTSRRTPATRPPPRRRSVTPSPATSPTAATAARTTTGSGRLIIAVTQSLRAGEPAGAASLLQKAAADTKLVASAASSKPSKPSSPAAATAPSPTPRI